MLTPVAGGRTCEKVALAVPITGQVLTTDRPIWVGEIRFWANTDLSAASVKIEAEGQTLFNNVAAAFALLDETFDSVVKGGAKKCYRYIPPSPILFDVSFPITITPTVACDVYIRGIPAVEPK